MADTWIQMQTSLFILEEEDSCVELGAVVMYATLQNLSGLPPLRRQSKPSLTKRHTILPKALLLSLITFPVWAQSIFTTQMGNRPAVVVSGDIGQNADQIFKATVGQLQAPLVLLSSPGGDVVAALEIGRFIRMRALETVVAEGQRCVSACALIWLAGAQRFMHQSSRIGFHAAYRIRGGRPEESGVGNAMIGSYLANLGLPERVVVYATSLGPNDTQWLTMADAERIGLAASFLPPGFAQPERHISERAPQPQAPQPATVRPPPPPPAQIAYPGNPGWTVDATNGCWLWNPSPQLNETVSWSGSCPNGPAVGYGTQVWRSLRNGLPQFEQYVGSKQDGRSWGQGTLTWGGNSEWAGDKYEGEFINGGKSRGTYTWSNGNRYVGAWSGVQRAGQGTFTWPNGTRYDGAFVNGQMAGQGTLTWPSGARYDGAFVNGQRTGQGTFTWPNGRLWIGEWRDGRRHGRGILIYPNGAREDGVWLNDQLQ